MHSLGLTGGTINFSGSNTTMINIDYNSGELNFNTHLGNDFKITSNLELDNIKSHKNIVEASLGENILKGETASIVASALVRDSLSQC